MTMQIAPSDRMHERLATLIAREIVAGRLAEDEVFPSSQELVTRYGVSRTVARETIQALQSAGLVNVQHGKRSTVMPATGWRFLENFVQEALAAERLPVSLVRSLYETRLCVETEAARRCAERCGDEDLQHLAWLARPLSPSVAATTRADLVTELVARDRQFHAAVADGSGNVVLARVAKDVHRGLLTSWAYERVDEAHFTEIPKQHHQIATALLAREPEAAAEAMQRHLEWSLHDHATLIEMTNAETPDADTATVID